MEKGLMKVLKDGAYVGVHPETESSQVTDFVTAVKATKVDNATASDTATKLAKSVSIGIGGAVTGTATQFDGSADIQITTTQLDASKLTGTATVDTTGKAATAGTADTSKSCSGNSATATQATQDSNGNNIATFYAPVSGNAGSHNALFRGKDLTSYFNSGAMSTAIAAGTFDDIYPGDYIVKSVTVNGTTYSNVEWVVGELDYHLHRGDTEDTTHHVLVFPRGCIGSKPMNATNITTGGFVGSVMWTTTLPLYATGIKAAFGAVHVLSHRELLSNAESDTVVSGAGAGWNGATTSFSWCDVTVNLFNEPMVYGGRVFSSSFCDVGDCNAQVAAMRHNKSLSFGCSYWYWLRAVASSSSFACAASLGYADRGSASNSGGGVRPYFLLY